MLDDWILLFFIMLPAVMFWVIPKLRKRNGSWLISLKTVPLGIVTLFLTNQALTRFYQWFCESRFENIERFHSSIRIGVPIGTALLTIALSGWIIHKKFRVGKRYNPLPSLLLFFPALICVSILGFMISMTLTFSSKGAYEGKWRPVYLPQEKGIRFAFEQQSIHQFLAEYNYRLRFVRDGQTTYQLLFTNCGGRTHFNLYRLKDGRLLFRDKDWDYVVDVVKQQVFRLENKGGKRYMARVPNKKINSWGGPEERDGRIWMYMGGHQVPAEEVSGILDGMTYWGCITDKFYPASRKPESRIEKRR